MDLIEYARESGLAVTRALSRLEQKNFGQFMTPAPVAKFMAQRCVSSEYRQVARILDPAAGAGILAAATVEALLSSISPPKEIQVILYELDGRLIPVLRSLGDRMRRHADKRGVKLSVSVRHGDFLLSGPAKAQQPIANIIISNPPYFKLNASDPRAVTHRYAVYGQPNIYGLFMAACAGLLAPGGRWCFITPRSWANGAYFASVRRHLFRCLHIDAMHLFESRKDHFTDDEILQEAMITWATTQPLPTNEIIVSTSEGSTDLAASALTHFPLNQIIGQDNEHSITLPTVASTVDMTLWTATLATYGLKVSTGPVVAFRATGFIKVKPSRKTVPLLWMNHINHMRISWPINKKREYIVANAESAWMLVPNANYVVMRRFSPKEDDRRVTAAPYLAGTLPGGLLGLENHTNYIYRPGGAITTEEVQGLAGFLNSRIIDQYFRNVAGNTQVNATDLRRLPLPPLDVIIDIGKIVPGCATLDELDDAIGSILRINQQIAVGQ